MEVNAYGWGNPLDTELYEQIIARGNLVSKPNKTPEEHVYLNENAPWILLRSGVDVATDKTLAKKYMLAGGTLETDGTSFWSTKGNNPLLDNSSYTLSEKNGFRPKPGIESIEVQTYTTMGCILKANVHFKVWSLEDLEAIDILYFKPGFSVLLEWGHSIHLTNSGQVVYADPATTVIPNTYFFESHTLDQIEEKVDEQRRAAFGNYEGLVGLLTNFSYSFSKSGGYDCSLEILSKGAILEEMKAPNTSPVTKPTSETIESSDTVDAESEDKPGTALEVIVKALSEWSTVAYGSIQLAQILKDLNYEANAAVNEVAGDMYVARFTVTIETSRGRWGNFWYGKHKKTQYLHYIVFEDFLKLCTAFQAPYGVAWKDKPIRFWDVWTRSNEFRTFKEHFSLDPGKFLLGTPPDFGELNSYIPKTDMNDAGVWPHVGPAMSFIQSRESLTEDGHGPIRNIWICLEYAAENEARCIASENADKSFRWDKWLKDYILADLQRCLGNVNSFDLVATGRKNSNIFTVVDRKLIKRDLQNRRIPVTGLKSTVEDLQIQSEVSKNIANQFSIAATGGTSDADDYASMAWRSNLTNRHTFGESGLDNANKNEKGADGGQQGVSWRPGDSLTSYPVESSKSFIEEATRLYAALFGGKVENKDDKNKDVGYREISATTSTNLMVAGADIFRKVINHVAGVTSVGGEEMPVGTFPCNINLTMKGLARFVIGEHFKVEPGTHLKRYDDWGWIITGVDHKVDKHGWVTNLKTQYFPPTKGPVETVQAKEPTKTTTTTTNTPAKKQEVLAPVLPKDEPYTEMQTTEQTPCRKATIDEMMKSLPVQPANSYSEAKARDGGSYCARYAGNLAAMFTGKLSLGSDISKKQGILGNAGGSEAEYAAVAAKLSSMGYSSIDGTGGRYVPYWTAQSKACSYAGGPQAGDVVHYQSQNGKHYHIAFYTGTQWVSNFKQNSAWVYGNYSQEATDWKVTVYRAQDVGC